MDDQSVFEAADFLKKEISDQRLRLTDLNGQVLMTVSSTYVSMDGKMIYILIIKIYFLFLSVIK